MPIPISCESVRVLNNAKHSYRCARYISYIFTCDQQLVQWFSDTASFANTLLLLHTTISINSAATDVLPLLNIDRFRDLDLIWDLDFISLTSKIIHLISKMPFQDRVVIVLIYEIALLFALAMSMQLPENVSIQYFYFLYVISIFMHISMYYVRYVRNENTCACCYW